MKTLPNEQAFWFCSSEGFIGRIAHSLEEFASEVKNAPIESLEFHLREDKNDFESWLRNSLKQKRLSSKMAKVKKLELKGEELRSALVKIFEKRVSSQPEPKQEHPQGQPAP